MAIFMLFVETIYRRKVEERDRIGAVFHQCLQLIDRKVVFGIANPATRDGAQRAAPIR
jgi:hypothetical protein